MIWIYNGKECQLEENKADLLGLPGNGILVFQEQIRIRIEYNCIYLIKMKELDTKVDKAIVD